MGYVVRSVGYAKKRSYADVSGPHRGDGVGPIGGRRCSKFGTFLKDKIFNFNYAVHVCCFISTDCKKCVSILDVLMSVCATAVEEVQAELREGVVSEQELRFVVKRYKWSSLNCLQSMVRDFLGKKMVSMAERMMVDDEVE